MIVLYNVRLYYCNALFEAKSFTTEDETVKKIPKYSVTVLIKKDEQAVKMLYSEVERVRNEHKISKAGNWFSSIVDGDDKGEHLEGDAKELLKDKILITATNYARPALLRAEGDNNKFKDIEEAQQFLLGGSYVHLGVEAVPYKHNNAYKGVKLNVHAVKFYKFGDQITHGSGVKKVEFGTYNGTGADDNDGQIPF